MLRNRKQTSGCQGQGRGRNVELFLDMCNILVTQVILEICCTTQVTIQYCAFKNLLSRSHVKCSYNKHKHTEKAKRKLLQVIEMFITSTLVIVSHGNRRIFKLIKLYTLNTSSFSFSPHKYLSKAVLFNPWSRKILYAMEQLSLFVTTTESMLQSS